MELYFSWCNGDGIIRSVATDFNIYFDWTISANCWTIWRKTATYNSQCFSLFVHHLVDWYFDCDYSGDSLAKKHSLLWHLFRNMFSIAFTGTVNSSLITIRNVIFKCFFYSKLAFRLAGSIRQSFSWVSICFYWALLQYCTRHCFYPFGTLKNRRRLVFSTMNSRFGKTLNKKIFFRLINYYRFFISKLFDLNENRFFFIVLVDTSCWAPIIAMKAFVFFSYEISGNIILHL